MTAITISKYVIDDLYIPTGIVSRMCTLLCLYYRLNQSQRFEILFRSQVKKSRLEAKLPDIYNDIIKQKAARFYYIIV